MSVEQKLFAEYEGLEDRITKKKTDIDTKDNEIRTGRKELGHLVELHEAIRYLQSHQKDKDPGKHGTAYFWVERYDHVKKEVITANKPTFYQTLHETGEQLPVIVAYEQTEDSPEYDQWTARICLLGREALHPIATIVNSNRFL